MKKQITIGVIGCGYWGPLLVRNFKSLPDCQLKAVCDLNTERLKHIRALYPDVEGLTQTQQLLNATNVDAVVIAAPVKHHWPRQASWEVSTRSSKNRWRRLQPSARN